MHNPEYALEDETHTFLWDFEIKIDHLIAVSVNKKKKKKNFRSSGFCRSEGPQSDNERQ